MGQLFLEKSEMIALLDLLGIEELIGLEPQHLLKPEPFERSIILEDGRSRLFEQGQLSVSEDHYVLDRELEAMMAIIANPQKLLRVRRWTPDSDEDFWCWFYASGTELVQLTIDGQEQFDLDWVSDFDSTIAQIAEILPLEPVSDAIHYRATADQEDADLVRTLLDDWDEVPALSIMEADGLTPAAAIEFYDDLTEPQWRGQVDLMACDSGQVTLHRRRLVLQGEELSWLAWQADLDRSDLHIQTASAGAFEELLRANLTELNR